MAIELIIQKRIAYPADERGNGCSFKRNGSTVRVRSTYEEIFFGDPEKSFFIVPCWQTCTRGDCLARKRAASAYVHLDVIRKLPWRKESFQDEF